MQLSAHLISCSILYSLLFCILLLLLGKSKLAIPLESDSVAKTHAGSVSCKDTSSVLSFIVFLSILNSTSLSNIR